MITRGWGRLWTRLCVWGGRGSAQIRRSVWRSRRTVGDSWLVFHSYSFFFHFFFHISFVCCVLFCHFLPSFLSFPFMFFPPPSTMLRQFMCLYNTNLVLTRLCLYGIVGYWQVPCGSHPFLHGGEVEEGRCSKTSLSPSASICFRGTLSPPSIFFVFFLFLVVLFWFFFNLSTCFCLAPH